MIIVMKVGRKLRNNLCAVSQPLLILYSAIRYRHPSNLPQILRVLSSKLVFHISSSTNHHNPSDKLKDPANVAPNVSVDIRHMADRRQVYNIR